MSTHEHMRRTLLPWRTDEEALTECGLPADPRTTLSRSEMLTKIAREGEARAALSSCMTCWQTANRHRKEERDGGLLDTVMREMGRVQWKESPERAQLTNELRAIVSLIESHRPEFDKLVRDFAEVVPLGTRRKRGRS